MKLTTETFGKHQIEIEVNSTTGEFSATFNDEDYRAATRVELFEKLKKAVKRLDTVKPIAVTVLGYGRKAAAKSWDSDPFMEKEGYLHAQLRGRHERNRTWLLVTDDDLAPTKFQLGDYRGRDAKIVRRLTFAEVKTYTKLLETMRVAKTALEDFVGALQVDPSVLLEQARTKGGE